MRKLILLSLVIWNVFIAFSSNNYLEPKTNSQDTLRIYHLDELVISHSVRETNDLRNLPSSVSILSPRQLQNNRIESLPDLSAFVPNFFVPSYGSRVSTPIYIRGIGARSGAQTVSLYVDNVPSFNPSVFDFEFQDIQRIEVLRGAQGTLYGRNAIGGIVNIYTLSPLTFQGTSAAITGGNYGQFSARASNYQKLSDNFGISVGGFYKSDDGYFINKYTGKKVDASENAGGRVKMEWNIAPRFKATLSSNYDWLSQGAFPYMHADSSMVNFNDPSSYDRNLATSGLSLQYRGRGFSINSTTGYQFLKDDMKMDQDYSPLSIFSIQQKQRQHSLSQEVIFRLEDNDHYNWLIGVFGFMDNRNINTPVTIKEDGTAFFSGYFPPFIKMLNDEIEMPGEYKKPTWGAALFYQSTLNELFGVRGLSATAGIRYDYEHTKIDYFTETQGVGVVVTPPFPPGAPSMPFTADTTMTGGFSKGHFEILPKFALQYRSSETSFLYASASKGYKSGGYNEQAFSQILRSAMFEAIDRLMAERMPGMPSPFPPRPENEPTLEEQLSYKPERSWTFEIGGRKELFDRRLSATFALFYSQVSNIQITQLLDGGTAGRIITNAGKSTSQGVELGLRYAPASNFSLFGEYGFANARFDKYETTGADDEGKPIKIDYSGNHIPFAPQHTLSVGANYIHRFARGAFIDRFIGNLSYNGIGKIYWTESNNVYQPFYGITSASIAAEKGIFGLELWTKNLFNTQYNAFFVEVSDMAGKVNPIVQRGIPTRVGATLRMMF
ncbi:MAG: TonB-dependent receptor [Dysgonamonadaceae bacterium]|nr:TonB-dependent receptor [Dysgonamonadaceae bacterium]